MVKLPVSGLLLGGRSGDDAPDGGVTENIFRQRRGVLTVMEGFKALCNEGRVAGKGLSH